MNKNNIYLGFELELDKVEGVDFEISSYHSEIWKNWGGLLQKKWRFETDGSLNSGLEIISNKFRLKDLPKIEKDLDKILKAVSYWEIDRYTGLHINYSIKNLDVSKFTTYGHLKKMKKIKKIINNEKFIKQYNRHYAREIRGYKYFNYKIGRKYSELHNKGNYMEWRSINLMHLEGGYISKERKKFIKGLIKLLKIIFDLIFEVYQLDEDIIIVRDRLNTNDEINIKKDYIFNYKIEKNNISNALTIKL